ncbi:hypothetical protein Btru_038010 [Bulinus truncatus]|nr:hypothetical protein Btru_038010 [Bulinus truncatus]
MSSAEESLMALLEAMLTLAARPKPQVKPGGHQEEHFLDLTEDERNEFSCNICYQILKETMQCVNNHKFCHSCLLVWSTTGQYTNRIRCPVSCSNRQLRFLTCCSCRPVDIHQDHPLDPRSTALALGDFQFDKSPHATSSVSTTRSSGIDCATIRPQKENLVEIEDGLRKAEIGWIV